MHSKAIQVKDRLGVQATKEVAALAQSCKKLRGFVHVSTAYVNANQPQGSHVEEAIYVLHAQDGSVLHHASLVAELAGLSRARAERKVKQRVVLAENCLNIKCGPYHRSMCQELERRRRKHSSHIGVNALHAHIQRLMLSLPCSISNC